MTANHDERAPETLPPDECWKQIGVMGDGSCPTLETAVHCRNCHVFVAAGRRLFEREPPAEYVEEQTRQLARQETVEATDTVAVLIFRIAEEWLAFDAGSVVEVAEPRAVHRVPHRSDRLLLGLVNIRGELQLCISLGELLGIEPGREPRFAPADSGEAYGEADDVAARLPSEAANVPTNRLLVAKHRQKQWVFAVDEVADVHRVGVDRLSNVPSTVAKSPRRFSRAVFEWDGKRVGYLTDDRLFESLEGSIG
ncbi:MAG: chemotaxis protein CheW [Planctomycetota bacterium]